MFALCEAIPREKKRSLPCLISVLDSFQTRALDTGDGDPKEPVKDAPPTYIFLLVI
jgi:hypothetical protein